MTLTIDFLPVPPPNANIAENRRQMTAARQINALINPALAPRPPRRYIAFRME